MKKLTTHAELVAHKGAKVTCYIRGKFIKDARIQVQNNKVYICQSKNAGGYRGNIWLISMPSYLYETDNLGCIDITLIEETQKLKRGDEVYVSDTSEEHAIQNRIKYKRIFYEISWDGFVCVAGESEENYKAGKYFVTTHWNYVVPVEKELPKEELITVQLTANEIEELKNLLK